MQLACRPTGSRAAVARVPGNRAPRPARRIGLGENSLPSGHARVYALPEAPARARDDL